MQRRNLAKTIGIRSLAVRIWKKILGPCSVPVSGRPSLRAGSRLLKLLSLRLQPRQFLARIRKDLLVFLNHFLEMFSLIGGRLIELSLGAVNEFFLRLNVPLLPCDFLIGIVHGVGMR